MNKKYIVRLSDAERHVCESVVRELKGSSQKSRRAKILLQADADGPAWTDEKIAESLRLPSSDGRERPQAFRDGKFRGGIG